MGQLLSPVGRAHDNKSGFGPTKSNNHELSIHGAHPADTEVK